MSAWGDGSTNLLSCVRRSSGSISSQCWRARLWRSVRTSSGVNQIHLIYALACTCFSGFSRRESNIASLVGSLCGDVRTPFLPPNIRFPRGIGISASMHCITSKLVMYEHVMRVVVQTRSPS